MSATTTEEKASGVCDWCDRESCHLTKLTGPDNSVQSVCWSCLYRKEKRINLKETWKRGRRG